MSRKFVRSVFIIAAAAACIAGASCGKSNKNAEIEGMWKLNDEAFNGGYIFGSDDLADVYVYPENTYLQDGEFFIFQSHIPKENVSYDGDILSLNLVDEELLRGDREGEPDKDSYQGDFKVTGGKMREAILGFMGVKEANSTELHMTVENEKIRFTALDVIEYSFTGKELEFKGRNGLPDSSGKAELSGDKLTIKRSDASDRVLTKVTEGEQK